jgi:hypothetical protein
MCRSCRSAGPFVTEKNFTVFGESTQGVITQNCYESMVAAGIKLPEWVQQCSAKRVVIGRLSRFAFPATPKSMAPTPNATLSLCGKQQFGTPVDDCTMAEEKVAHFVGIKQAVSARVEVEINPAARAQMTFGV